MKLKIFKGYERFDNDYPSEQVKYALEHKEEAIPELLRILEYTVKNAESLFKDNKYLIHFSAIYLLAYFREKRAYKGIIQLLSYKDEIIYGLLGDTVTEELKNILASVCDGNINPLKKIIENPLIDEFVRCEALEALLVLLNEEKLKREELVFYFKELMNGKLEKDYSYIWELLPSCCSLIHPKGLINDVEQAIKDGKIDSFLVDWDLMDTNLRKTSKEVLRELKENENYYFINKEDIFLLEDWVGGFNLYDEYYEDDDWFENEDTYYIEHEKKDEYQLKKDKFNNKLINIPFIRDSRESLNSLCPCGSNKKYKNCCFWKEKNKF